MSTAFTQLDKDRFNAWFEHDSRLPDLADELHSTVLELAEWARQPHIAEALDAVATIARQRHATLRAEAQHAATARLLRIVRCCDHDEIARRAADRLLRSLPAGERPLDDEESARQANDKDVHATQPPRTDPTLPPLRIAAIDTPTQHEQPLAADHPLRAPAPASPPIPPPAGELTNAPRSLESIAAAILDAAETSGMDPDELDEPGAIEGMLEYLNIDDDDIDIDELQDAIDDAQLDRDADAFESTHGVPITHPAIRAAIADFRIDDIPTIAATIRANAPP